MVGPRSTGCRTCVGHRVRCDRERPYCKRCRVAGYQCVGYTPPVRFMPPVTLKRDVPAEEKDSKAGKSRPTKRAGASRSPNLAGSGIVVSRDGTLRVNMPGLTPPPEVTWTPSSHTDDAYCMFFLDRCFCSANWNQIINDNKVWVWRALQSPSQYPVSNAACRALAAIFFVQVHRTASLDQYARNLHGLALRAMASETQNASISFDILAANSLLLYYEVRSLRSRNAWLTHSKAMRGLYQKLGPEYFKLHRSARSILMMNRYAIINTAIVTRERCFLADPEWLDILTCDDAEGRLTIKLGDVVAQAPMIFERIKELEHLPDPGHASLEAQDLLHELLRHLQDLKTWWYQRSLDPRRLPTRTAMTISDDATMPAPPDSPMGQPLTFSNIETAGSWTRYHSHVVLALVWMRRLLNLRIEDTILIGRSKKHPSLKFLTRDSASAFQVCEEEIQQHAVAVCEGLHVYSLPKYRHIGAIFMGVAVRTAWHTLPSGSPHSVWLERLVEFMAVHSGFSAPSHMLAGIEINE